MSGMKISEAAHLLGVSDDTVRRWLESGRLAGSASWEPARSRPGGSSIRSTWLASCARRPTAPRRSWPRSRSSRVQRATVSPASSTRVERDGVMALVEIQAGPHRVVSLMSREAADELRLEPGVRAVAAVKATNVVVEVPGR